MRYNEPLMDIIETTTARSPGRVNILLNSGYRLLEIAVTSQLIQEVLADEENRTLGSPSYIRVGAQYILGRTKDISHFPGDPITESTSKASRKILLGE